MEVAKDLLEQVSELDDAQTIRSAIDMALYNAGVDRLLRTSRTH
jgi:phosphotransferase system enzyme I (PtsP)